MSSTELSTLLADQDFFLEEEATVELIPDQAFLNSNSLLTLLESFDPTLADLVADFAGDLPSGSGQIAVTGGRFDANVLLSDGSTLVGIFDAPTTLRGFADLAAVSTGSATLTGGILEAAIALDDQPLIGQSFDLSAIASTLVLDAINAIDATVPFVNGAFALDLATALGPISGTIDIAGGDLNLDLATPFGQLVADVAFGADAIVPFSAPVPLLGSLDGVVDFSRGNIVAPLGILGDLAVPIDALSGSLTLRDGLASLDATLPLGSGLSLPVATDLAIGPLASEYVAGLVQDLNGVGTLIEGVFDATLDSPLGIFGTTFDLVAFTNQGADFFAGVDGVITLGEGLATAALTKPLGGINDSFALTAPAELLEAPVAELI